MSEQEVKKGEEAKAETPVSPERAQDLQLNTENCELSLEKLLKAGAHFGHKKSRWNPRMGNYLFGVRNGVHVIDLEKTLEMFRKALDFMKESVVAKNGQIMIVGTKKQAKELVKKAGEELGMPYVNERWLGGTFTNFSIISKRIKYLESNKEALEKGRFSHLTKLERLKMKRELEGLEEKMGGLQGMKKLPEAVFILDVNKDELALKEAKKEGVKTIGIIDSNGNPEVVDYPIPANDDAVSSLKYILEVFLCEIKDAKGKTSKKEEAKDKKALGEKKE